MTKGTAQPNCDKPEPQPQYYTLLNIFKLLLITLYNLALFSDKFQSKIVGFSTLNCKEKLPKAIKKVEFHSTLLLNLQKFT